MKPSYQPKNNSYQHFSEQPVTPNLYNRSPEHKFRTLGEPHVQQPNVLYNPLDAPAKKISTCIKALGDKIQGVEAIVRRNSGRFQKNGMNLKTQPHREKEQSNFVSSPPLAKMGEFQSIRKQQSESDLRVSCPNIFRKFQQTALRNTMQTNNYTKFGNIMAEIKKHDEEEHKAMKKQVFGNSEATATSTPRIEQKPVTNNFFATNFKKPPIEKTLFKSKTELKVGISTRQKENQNTINGFIISKQLGKGKFGEVYLGKHAQTGFIVALKKIIKSKLVEFKMIQQFKRQIRLHSSLDHPNIVKFYGFFQHDDNIYLILEYVSGGTLFDYLTDKEMLKSKEAVQYLRDTIQALNYMHERSIAHRDIKPENIVLTVGRVAKLCDFGWSALVESSRTTYCGTFDYAPPEILERKNYDIAVDIWCMGVLTYEILTGRVPFQGQKRKQIMEKILSVDKNKIYYPVDVPDDAKSFIEQLVQKDPASRPKCRDLLKHPFFTNNLKGPPLKKL